jgi:hypothetical protein
MKTNQLTTEHNIKSIWHYHMTVTVRKMSHCNVNLERKSFVKWQCLYSLNWSFGKWSMELSRHKNLSPALPYLVLWAVYFPLHRNIPPSDECECCCNIHNESDHIVWSRMDEIACQCRSLPLCFSFTENLSWFGVMAPLFMDVILEKIEN